MATTAKATKATPAAPVAATPAAPVAATPAPVAPVAANPFAALVAAPVAPAPSAHAVMVAKAQAVNNQVAVGALAGIVAANNVAARAASLAKVPAQVAAVSYTLGRPCKVRVPYTLACYQAVAGVLAAGPATGQALAAASTGDFVRYAVKNGWLVAA